MTETFRTVFLGIHIVVLMLILSWLPAYSEDLPTGMFQPLPKTADSPANPVTPEKVTLGKKLYFDPILSESKKISCNSCHDLARYGVDNDATSLGHNGQRGDRNSPTVLNAALLASQFWDGRAADVEAQALGPVMNPKEMAMPDERVLVERLKSSKDYPILFASAFPGESDPVTFQNMGKAIGAFERTLLTPSRFDDLLRGNQNALNEQEKRGLKLFVSTGCTACHMGATVGGQLFQKLGLLKPYPTKDLGRFAVTKNEADKSMFKVPSLRNVEKTAPYFHDGSIPTLERAVKTMAEYQLGRTLSDNETADIVAFLKSLTGKLPQ